MYAYAGQNVSSLAIRKIQQTERVDRFSAAKVSFLKGISPSVPSIIGRWLGGACARIVLSKADSTAEKAIFFRGAAVDLFREIQDGSAAPQESLVAEIDSFSVVLTEAISSCSGVIPQMRKRNESSQVALAFEQMVIALEDVRSSISVLRTVATGGSLPGFVFPFSGLQSWESGVEHQRSVFNEIRATIRSGDTSDIDPDLLALADQAIAASDSRDLASDADWPQRMVGERLH